MQPQRKRWKVGELARATGLTVRTLHHYDRIGLLQPSARSSAGYRLYGEQDVARLQQIRSLRQLGFTLEQIRELLDRRGGDGASHLRVIEMHLARLREQVRAQQRLCDRLERIAKRLRAAEEVPAEELIQSIVEMTMFERYYTPEQLEQLAKRREALGEERIREVEAEWPRLMEEVRAEMEKGTDPSDPRVQALAQRWRALIEEFTGGDPGIAASLKRLYEQETTVHGLDTAAVRAMGEYIGRALAARREGESHA
ncbi:MAG TPA: MerR family transcriptional regulator [Longimicrobiales bacterium]